MAVVEFYYYDPLDAPNSGGSFVRCQATYELERISPTQLQLTVNTKIVGRKDSLEFREYDIEYDNGSHGISDVIYEKIEVGKEWDFTQTFIYEGETIDVNSGLLEFQYFAYFKGLSETGEQVVSGYDVTVQIWYPGWIEPPISSVPEVYNVKPHQFSFYWNVLYDGQDYPTLMTEMYNHPSHPGEWVGIQDIGYGYVSSGTITELDRYTTYGLRSHVKNSAGEFTSEEILFKTMPEDPVLSPLIIYDITTESAKYSWSVVDNGGKGITQYKIYILGGQYNIWTEYSSSALAESTQGEFTGLLHNTTYEVRVYATNDLSESYSTIYKFTTSGNPPTITQFRAEDIKTNQIRMYYTCEVDYGALFQSYFIEYREYGQEDWITLPENTRVLPNLKCAQRYEIKLTVIDNAGKQTTSNIVDVYTRAEQILIRPPKVNFVDTEVTVTEDFTLPENVQISANYIIMCSSGGVDNLIILKQVGDNNEIQSITFDSSLDEHYMHPYKRYTFYYVIRDNVGNLYTSGGRTVQLKSDHSTTKIIKSTGEIIETNGLKIVNRTTNGNEAKLINYRDIVKLSNKMRYIMLGSTGLINHTDAYIYTFTEEATGDLKVTLRIKVTCFENAVKMQLQSADIIATDPDGFFTNTNDSFKVEIVGKSGIKLISLYSPGEINSENPNLIDYSLRGYDWTYFSIDDIKDGFDVNIDTGRLYNSNDDLQEESIEIKDIVIDFANKRYCDNSVVEVNVYDDGDSLISDGKQIISNQGTEIVFVNNGNATDGNTSDPDRYVRASGADTLLLDLEEEYNVSKIEVWRRYSDSFNYLYGDNFIYGLNSEKEICYKFFDYRQDDSGDGYSETAGGRTFIVQVESEQEGF